jgi:glyoxylate reductase
VGKIYMTRMVPGPALSMLKERYDVVVNKKSVQPTRKELLRNVAGKDAILCMLSDRIDRQVIDAAGPNLKIISSYSTGYEHIDVEEATKRGIYVTYIADLLAEATADLTFALILACARNVAAGDRMIRQKKWKVGWAPDLLLGQNVYGATLGIIGLGRIGAAVARRASGFKMNLLYHNRNRNKNAEEELGAKYVGLDELLAASDFVSIHTSMNEASYHMINKDKLQKMKKTAFLINTARGKVVKEADLAAALRNGRIAGAGLDVFESEPLAASSPLLKMGNVTLLPHIGSATHQTRSKMGEVAAQSILQVLDGKSPDPHFVVNRQILRTTQSSA